ncbi:hybrid sensor histidine kinase/response regulator [Ohtaekwangia sp.]|uniref:hybrid sensor histidine kinase/response regulator n=1 Tax=Ohtaekwangia sp. TaxID=2066019 RepID=UPI002F94E64D
MRIWLSFALLFSVLYGYPQNAPLSFQHIGAREGLSHSNVTCILQDSRGFMWFGTRDGLNKYDGYTFTVYRNNANDTTTLENNYITDIMEDPSGRVWIATWGGGINVFHRETEKFSHYIHDPENVNSLASDQVKSILRDHDGLLWIGTDGGGLDVYDEKRKSFTHYKHISHQAESLASNNVIQVLEDHLHNIWITTADGLSMFDRQRKSFVNFRYSERNPHSLSHNDTKVLFEDSRNRLWVGTRGGGLNLYRPETHDFQRFKHDSQNKTSVGHSFILSLNEDAEGNLWVGTENGGLSIFNDTLQSFQTYFQDDIDPASLSGNSIWSIYKDQKGNMWVGTFSGGVSLSSKERNNFRHFRHTSSVKSLGNNKVLCIYEDSHRNLWVTTDGGGLNLLDRSTGNFKHFRHEENNPRSIGGDYVLNIREDSKGNLWIGTWGAGVTIYDPKKNTYRHLKYNAKDTSSLRSNNAWSILEDKDKRMWIGTYNGGLNLYHPETNSFTAFVHDSNNPKSIASNKVILLYQDTKGRIWVGTDGGGLDLFDPVLKTFQHYAHRDGVNSISNNAITQIHEDVVGNFWIGTMSGLNYFDVRKQKFTVYRTTDGLPNDAIAGILEDKDGNLWISTNKGLSKYNPATLSFRNFDAADGLQSNEFKPHASFLSKSGVMYFGGANGFNEFFPDRIKEDHYKIPIVLTDFQLFNTSVSIGDSAAHDSPLTKSITETDAIALRYDRSVISFEFAALNYTDAERKTYSYFLEGFDKSWNQQGTQRRVTYTNLDPGTYIFKVKGADSERSWDTNILSLKLVITPPFWKTWWFITVAIVLATGSAYLLYRLRTASIQRQKRELEKQVRERTAEAVYQKEILEHQAENMQVLNMQLQEQANFLHAMNDQLKQQKNEIVVKQEEAETARREAERANQAKSIFLATMSHEIRTPMNGVLGMASLLAETALTQEQQEYTNTIRGSGEALLTVINDILDFSKIESGNLELDHHNFDLRQCIEEVMDVFAGKAGQKSLDLVYQIDYRISAQLIGDSHRLRQVLLNLIGNAMKFTHQGEIFVGVDLLKNNDGKLELAFEVRDTGIGIPADKLSRLFKAFSQVDSSTTRKYGGTGLGLIISKRLVELMGGYITVESQPDVGTIFRFTFHTEESRESIRQYALCSTAGNEGKKVLIVDDNVTNLAILKNQLEHWNFTPTLAASGQQAMQILSSAERYDLVISDMQMPVLDGIRLTQMIKNNHPQLPVILLSSVGDESRKKYADLFCAILTKPVKQQQLCKVIHTALRPMKQTTGREENIPNQLLSESFAEQYPLRILVADDNPVNQKLALLVLNKLGYRDVCITQNGVETLEKFDEQFYDIILMDVQMPEMDGLETTRMIRLKRYHQPVIIAVTANAMQGDREDCAKAGMDDYISKPIKFEVLVEILKKWAKMRQSNPGIITT